MRAEPDRQLFDLVKKYNRPGPRYTSYPPAPHFSADFGSEDFRASLTGRRTGAAQKDADGPGQPSGLSVYVHLPFCRSLCYYCGCHMIVTGRPERIHEYLGYLEQEIDVVAAEMGEPDEVTQLHWGGGTPTYLSPEQIRGLMDHLGRRFDFAPGAELSLEGDPRGLTIEHLQAARESGFNRLSLGVQDFDERVQKAINREQSIETVETATEAARRLGYHGINYDLVYGLPHQTVDSFRKTLSEVLRLRPDRISLFSYAHVPWKKKHQRVILDEWLPSSEEKIRIFLDAQRALTQEGGYRYIGMDHFALPGDPLVAALEAGTLQRNFQGYSTHGGADLVGFGLSAISHVRNAYAQNILDLPGYYAALDQARLPTARGYRLTEDDKIREAVISRLMCSLRLDVSVIESRFKIDFWTYFADSLRELRDMEADGLVEIEPDHLEVTEAGRLFIRNVAMAFDAYLDAGSANAAPRYSATV